MSSISAGTSSGTALVSTGDTSGALQLQVNGTTPSVTLAANGSIGVGSSPSYGTNGQVLTSSGTGSAPTWATVSAGFTLGTPVATTSGTSIDFTGIPAGVKSFYLMFDGVSVSGTNSILVRLGDAGGFETSGYISGCAQLDSGVSVDGSTSGFMVTISSDTADLNYGLVTFSLENASAFTWCSQGNMRRVANVLMPSAGRKSLSQELTQIRITVSGANTFDAGEINIAYI